MEKVLSGVHLPRNWTSLIGALEGFLAVAGRLPVRPGIPDAVYLMGVTGFAFRNVIDLMVTPEGPGHVNIHLMFPLWENLGIWCRRVYGHHEATELPALREDAWAHIQASMEKGWPAIAYDLANRAEYGLIVGTAGVGADRRVQAWVPGHAAPVWVPLDQIPTPGHAPVTRLEVITAVCVAGALDHTAAVTASLRFAVDHAWAPPSHSGWLTYGLAAYDTWMANLGLPMHPGPEPGYGHAYCAAVVRQARHDAASYLHALSGPAAGDIWAGTPAGRDPNQLQTHLADAAVSYGSVAGAMDAVCDLLPFPDTPGFDRADVRRQVRQQLVVARSHEEHGVAALEKALRQLKW